MDPELLCHVRMMHLFTELSVGAENVEIEVKLQSVYHSEDVIKALLDPDTKNWVWV